MTDPRLTAEQIAELRKAVTLAVGAIPGETLRNALRRERRVIMRLWEHRHALLSAAERLVELESALHYLQHESPMSTSDFEPAALLMLAKQLGWPSPARAEREEP